MSDESVRRAAGRSKEAINKLQGFDEPHYTKIPNELFSLIPRMSDAELRVTLVIARETLGWHKEWSKGPRERTGRTGLSTTGLMGLTGMSKPSVQKGVKEGIERGTIDRCISGESYKYRLRITAMIAPDEEADDDDEADAQKVAKGGEEMAAGELTDRQESFPSKNITKQKDYHPPVTNLPRGGQNNCPGMGKNLTPHKEEINQNKKQESTPAHINKAALATPSPVVSAGSRFSPEECRRFAEHLKATGQGIINPGGYATKIYRSGEADAQVQSFLASVSLPSARINLIDLIGSPNWRSRVYAQLSRMKGATKDRTLQGDIDLLFSVLFVVSADEFRIQLATFNSRQAEQSRASA